MFNIDVSAKLKLWEFLSILKFLSLFSVVYISRLPVYSTYPSLLFSFTIPFLQLLLYTQALAVLQLWVISLFIFTTSFRCEKQHASAWNGLGVPKMQSFPHTLAVSFSPL